MMKIKSCDWKLGAAALLLLALAFGPPGSGAQTGGPTFSGQARVAQATVLGSTTILADTGTLDESGDAREASSSTGAIPNLLSADALHATAMGGEFADEHRTDSEASLGSLVLSVAGNNISADFAMARASAVCGAWGASLSGVSDISGLSINGVPLTVTGAPDQTVTFPGGQLVINEQRPSGTTATVNALHVLVNGVADVVISSAQAGIACGS